MIYGIHKTQKTAISLSHLAAFAECATFPGSLKTSGTGSGIHSRSSQEGNASLFRKGASGRARRSLPDGSPPHLAVASQFIVDQHQTDDDLGVSVLPGGEASSRHRQTRQLNSTTPRPAEIFERALSRRANISTLRSCKQLHPSYSPHHLHGKVRSATAANSRFRHHLRDRYDFSAGILHRIGRWNPLSSSIFLSRLSCETGMRHRR
jgi:hypothetical protein